MEEEGELTGCETWLCVPFLSTLCLASRFRRSAGHGGEKVRHGERWKEGSVCEYWEARRSRTEWMKFERIGRKNDSEEGR